MSYKHQLVVGDRKTPLTARLHDDGKDNDLSGATVTFDMYDSAGTQVVADGSCTVQPGITFTADTSNDRYVANGHGLADGWEVIVSSSTTLPSPLSATTRYFVRDCTDNHFKLSTEKGGTAIDPTDAGTGTHTLKVLGQVQYSWASGDVDSAGSFKGWFTVTESSVSDTFPNDSSGIAIVIQGVG